MTALPPLSLPWYRRPARVPVWFVLVALLGWAIHLWHGVFPVRDRAMLCTPITGNPYRDPGAPPGYSCRTTD